MTVIIGDLVRDVELSTSALAAAKDNLDIASRRLIDGLAMIGAPLLEKSVVVVGGYLISRQYSTLPVELKAIDNVSVHTVVVASDTSLQEDLD